MGTDGVREREQHELRRLLVIVHSEKDTHTHHELIDEAQSRARGIWGAISVVRRQGDTQYGLQFSHINSDTTRVKQ